MHRIRATVFLLGIFFGLQWVSPLSAQPEQFNHPELDWYSIESEHFFVHFHAGAERTARVTGKIAEEVYEPITSLYQYKPPGKMHFIIRDHDDYSNGAAFFYDNKVEIWAPAAAFEFRGAHNWLRNVITHEFTHMIQINAARKITQRIPAFYFQAIGYEDDRREDVLHGGPNVIASYPLAMTVMPGWFAEGVAQYQVPGLDYDSWDTHRDMILRTATIDNQLLTFNEMGVFGKNSLGNEKVYNHGYAFVSYLADRFGIEALRSISVEMKGLFRTTLDGAIKKATGHEARTLYADWVKSLRVRYAVQLKEVTPRRAEGTFVEEKGIGNFSPAWSPDGTRLAYLTTGGNDYLSQTALVVKHLETGATDKIAAGAKYGFSWSPDGTKLAFADKSARSKGGSRYFDLYVFDLATRKKERVTFALRAHSPHWSPDAGQLVFIKSSDGTDNLMTVDLTGKNLRKLTHFENGEQIARPQFSPDGKSVLYSTHRRNGQDIYQLELGSGKIRPIVNGAHDSRDAVWSTDSQSIYFSWDRTGIFNIYELNLESGRVQQLTNVTGGAFMPARSKSGQLAFTNFTSGGFKISRIENPEPVEVFEIEDMPVSSTDTPALASASTNVQQSIAEGLTPQSYDDSKVPNLTKSPYRTQYAPISFLPRVMVDYGTLKIGTYLYSFEVLNKYGFLAGVDFNSRGDYDLFALLEYRKFGPTLFLEAYNQVQNTDFDVDSTEVIRRQLFNREVAQDKFRYNLLEANLGVSFKLGEANELRTAFIISRYSTRAKFDEATGVRSTLNFNYFIGRDISVKFKHRGLRSHRHSAISPLGRSFTLGYDREFDRFLVDFATDRVVSAEVFENYNFNKFTLDWQEHRAMPIAGHTLSLDVDAGYIDTKVDSFFNFFAGGMLGNRGYPLYSIEGRKLLQARATYRFPLFKHLDSRLAHLYFDKVFLGLFFDYGNAFSGSLALDSFKSSLGAELRMDSFSFYSFPTRMFFGAAYGLDQFQNSDQIYGHEWRYYFGLSFGYFD